MLTIHKIKQEICDIGYWLYKKGFAAANDGNISYRFDENQVVCTPTGISKGFMKPDDLCLVDMEGCQTGGHRKMTSEIKLHLAIMLSGPQSSRSSTAIRRTPPPSASPASRSLPAVLPEVELFLGEVPTARRNPRQPGVRRDDSAVRP